MNMRNRTLATYLGAALAAAGLMNDRVSVIDDFHAKNPPRKEEPQRTRYGGQKERERREKRLAASKGA